MPSRKPHHAFPRRRRGVAMLLLLVTLSLAVVMSLSFLNSSTTSTAIARNMHGLTPARSIAEAALELTLQRIRDDAEWRTTMPHGEWVTDAAFNGGTCTVEVIDGIDTDGDGTIDGDNDLANNDDDPFTIIATGSYGGVTHTVRYTVEAAVEAVGGNHGVAVATEITLSGNARIDAMNSTQSIWFPNFPNPGKAVVATNSGTNAHVSLSGSAKINGDVLVGPGGDPGTVIDTQGSSTITGQKAALADAMELSTVTPPALPASLGSKTWPKKGSGSLAAGVYHYSDFNLGNNYVLTVSGDVTIYCDNAFKVEGNSVLNVATGGKLAVHAASYALRNNARINAPVIGLAVPSRVTLNYTGTGDMKIENNFKVAATILAPNARLTIENNASVFGMFQGKALNLANNAQFTQDLSMVSDSSGGGATASVSYTPLWEENP